MVLWVGLRSLFSNHMVPLPEARMTVQERLWCSKMAAGPLDLIPIGQYALQLGLQLLGWLPLHANLTSGGY